MAGKLDVTEYTRLARDNDGRTVLTPAEPANTTQQVAVDVSHAESAAFGDATRFVRVHSDTACRIVFGKAPVAAATSMRMSAGATEYFGVLPGHKISVIATT